MIDKEEYIYHDIFMIDKEQEQEEEEEYIRFMTSILNCKTTYPHFIKTIDCFLNIIKDFENKYKTKINTPYVNLSSKDNQYQCGVFYWDYSGYYLEIEIGINGKFDWWGTDKNDKDPHGNSEPTAELLECLMHVLVLGHIERQAN